jgi:hypothetical protein
VECFKALRSYIINQIGVQRRYWNWLSRDILYLEFGLRTEMFKLITTATDRYGVKQ